MKQLMYERCATIASFGGLPTLPGNRHVEVGIEVGRRLGSSFKAQTKLRPEANKGLFQGDAKTQSESAVEVCTKFIMNTEGLTSNSQTKIIIWLEVCLRNSGCREGPNSGWIIAEGRRNYEEGPVKLGSWSAIDKTLGFDAPLRVNIFLEISLSQLTPAPHNKHPLDAEWINKYLCLPKANNAPYHLTHFDEMPQLRYLRLDDYDTNMKLNIPGA
ncbi:hypothetical protein EVAR_43563_1 [Eumeta japonica]|uniref:Uncharacterized protein n=1 Tax=Eumeta variegata TaxID=151549 RepID=A0A4C1WA14_EUMVA|nr:hypothetical protein EVAR_43563_1 [Eumeta japonica]